MTSAVPPESPCRLSATRQLLRARLERRRVVRRSRERAVSRFPCRPTDRGSAAAAPRGSEYQSGGRRASIAARRLPAVRPSTATKAGVRQLQPLVGQRNSGTLRAPLGVFRTLFIRRVRAVPAVLVSSTHHKIERDRGSTIS